MFRSLWIASAAALTCATATAQRQLDASNLHPVTSTVKDAGTINLITGKRTPAGQGALKAGGVQTVFNNTCTWAGGAFYGGTEDCEDVYDGGRIPSTGPVGAEPTNAITTFQIAYCTYVGTVTPVDIEVAFWDNLGGDCVGALPPTPPPPSCTATAYFDLSGLGLPGSTAVGFQACWIVNIGFGANNAGFCLQSDGDGVFNNDPTVDKFTWLWRHNNANGANPNGFLIAGEPASGGYGACSYNIACGTNPMTGTTCGTGLDEFDAYWINVDGVGVGVTTSGLCPNGVAPFGGTNCYFFGGYPTNPLAANWLVLDSIRGGCTVVQTFCTANNNSCNKIDEGILRAPAASVDVNAGTFVLTNGVVAGGALASIVLYSATQSAGTNTGFGWLCLSAFKRIPATIQTTSGPLPMTVLAPAGCTGCYSYNLHNFLNPNSNGTITSAGFPDPTIQSANLPVAGSVRHFQGWYRDTPPNPARFSTGVSLTLLP